MLRRIAALLILTAAAAIAPAQVFYGGGSSTSEVRWTLCAAASCSTGTNLTALFISTKTQSFKKCYAAAKTGPTGAALIIELKHNGTSIFGANPKLQIADGATTGSAALFSATAAKMIEGDTVSIDIVQAGSSTPGKDVSISCVLK